MCLVHSNCIFRNLFHPLRDVITCFVFSTTIEAVISCLLHFFAQNIAYSPLWFSHPLQRTSLFCLGFTTFILQVRIRTPAPAVYNFFPVTVLWAEASDCLLVWHLADTHVGKLVWAQSMKDTMLVHVLPGLGVSCTTDSATGLLSFTMGHSSPLNSLI